MLSYKLRTNFEHIKGNSWDPISFRYRQSFLVKSEVDYQIDQARKTAIVPRTILEQEWNFDPRSAEPSDHLRLRYWDKDLTSISFKDHHRIDLLCFEDFINILDAKTDRLLRDFSVFEQRVLSAWKRNSCKWIGVYEPRHSVSYPKRFDLSVNSKEFAQIKAQLAFEKEVFYWSNIRAFEYDFDQSGFESLSELRTKYYDQIYHLDEHNKVTRSWNSFNPFVYPSEKHYRFWSENRDLSYKLFQSEDQYWDSEAKYYKDLVFSTLWTKFVDDWNNSTIPGDLELRAALDCTRNPESARIYYLQRRTFS